MKWKKFTLKTTTEAVDYISSLFDEIGIQGIEIEDNVPLTESETKGMFIDIIQAITFGTPEGVIRFCEGIQAAAPVDSFVTPEPWAMPGYDSDVIMAAGAFIQGASIELSADAPIKPPDAVYFQGGLTWYHAKLGILMSLQKLCDAGIVNL